MFKPSDKLIELFNEELEFCGGEGSPCGSCRAELSAALGYSGDMLWNDAMLDEDELQDRIVTMTTAEFEKQLSQLEQNAIWYGLSQFPEKQETAERLMNEARESLRNLFYSRKQES